MKVVTREAGLIAVLAWAAGCAAIAGVESVPGGDDGGVSDSGSSIGADSGSSSGSSSDSGAGSGSSSGSGSSGSSGSSSGGDSGSGDDGGNAACSSPAQCGGSPQVCCETLTLTGGCVVTSSRVFCADASSCMTQVGLNCIGNDVARLCAQAADCTEPMYDQCCILPLSGTSIQACATQTIASFLGGTCM